MGKENMGVHTGLLFDTRSPGYRVNVRRASDAEGQVASYLRVARPQLMQ